MTSSRDSRTQPSRLATAALALQLFGAPVVACDSESGAVVEESFQKVMPSGRIFSVADFQGAGFKESKQYDVEGLPQATGAWFGFFRLDGEGTIDYELRFYASHEDAVEYGTALAEEVTGEDALLSSDKVTWKEGANDRRRVIGGGSGAEAFSGAAARYGDFVILGNVVLLCEGADSVQSLDRCSALIEAVQNPDG